MHLLTSWTLLALSLSAHQGVCAPRSVDLDFEDVRLQLQMEDHETGNTLQVQPQTEHEYRLDALYPHRPSLEQPQDDADTYIDIDNYREETTTTTTTNPTRYHSTLLARRLLALSATATLTTLFPHNISSIPAYSRTPPDVAGISIGLPEYIADCDDTGDVTIIALGVSTSTRNVEYGDADHEGGGKGRNVSLSLSWWDQYFKVTHREPWSMANLPRVSLVGYMQDIPDEEVVEKKIEECFLRKHGDSRLWLPGRKSSAHQGKWARVVVQEVYWIGGFGGSNYIGWLSPGEWRGVRREDWRGVRLRGEKD